MHYCTAVAVLLDPNANTTNAIIARNYKGHGGPFWPLMTVVPAKWRRDQAYFGYPQAHKDDAERAARAGLELVAKIGQLLLPSGEPLQVRVGIATGLVVVGETFPEGPAQEQAAVGITPNLAARLQTEAD